MKRNLLVIVQLNLSGDEHIQDALNDDEKVVRQVSILYQFLAGRNLGTLCIFGRLKDVILLHLG